jgi:NAD(P)-dependent dehydrogenase (short-subunit alcohol dehydrogenase family)
MSADLTGRTALVTGAGRGIGAAVAIGLAEAGASLILIARSGGQLAETAAAIGANPHRGQVRTVTADVADDAERQRAIDDALGAGPVDILINNAATVEPLGASSTITAAQLRQAFDVNVVAVAGLSAALVPAMVKAGWGRVVNVSSGIVANPGGMIGGNAYATTKAALEAHTRNLAAELAGTGVTANVYRPGQVDTAMQGWIRGQDSERIGSELHDRFTRTYASGQLIRPGQSAAALLGHLLGDDGERSGAVWNLEDTVAA